MQYIGSRWKPFATGMFMLFEREAFWRLGGFNERALFAEDYLLSKRVARNRFRIVRGSRSHLEPARFRKLGHSRMIWMFLQNHAPHPGTKNISSRDQGYWGEAK